jgi:type I restriction enzyme S subunit
MKSVWQTKKLGEVCVVVNGGTPKTGINEHWGGKNYWITPAEMGNRSSPYVDDTERTISDLGLQNCSATPLPPYSVILSSRAPIGHLVINIKPMSTNQGCKGLVPNKSLDHKFLYHYLSSIIGLLNDLGTGTTFKEISGGKLKEVSIPLPPLPEQHRIVAILDKAFEGIATAKANTEKNLKNARELFESYLNSVFTQKGDGWVKTTLESVLVVQPQNGWSPPAINHSDFGTPVLTLSAVTGFLFRASKIKFTSASTNSRRHYWVKNGDLLITRSNTPELVGHVAIASGIIEPTIYPDLIMRMIPSPDRALTEFLYYQLRSPSLRKEITSRAQGANPTMKKLSNGAVKSIPINIPPIATQRIIVETFNGLHVETKRLESLYKKKLLALDELKQSLLHQAFTGQLSESIP